MLQIDMSKCMVSTIEWFHEMPNGTSKKIKTARTGDPHTHTIGKVWMTHAKYLISNRIDTIGKVQMTHAKCPRYQIELKFRRSTPTRACTDVKQPVFWEKLRLQVPVLLSTINKFHRHCHRDRLHHCHRHRECSGKSLGLGCFVYHQNCHI